MTTRYDREHFISEYSDCNKRECFVPFRGNGIPICRLYELGKCKHGPKVKKN
jgi:hypothetical protein